MIRAKRERCFLYRFTDGVRTWQRTSDIPANARNRKKAERQAAELENEFTEAGGVEIEWAEAIVRYNTEHLEGLSSSYRSSFHSAAEALKVSANPYFAADITSADLSTFTAELRKKGKSEATITSYLKTLLAFLRWLDSLGLIEKAPEFKLPKRPKTRKEYRSRPITEEEFDRMLEAVPVCRPFVSELWVHILHGIWLGGFRRSEIPIVSWDWSAPMSLQVSDPPHLKITIEGDKKGADYFAPVAPDFVEYMCNRTPPDDRKGRIFRVDYEPDWIGRTISRFGEHAGIIVNDEGKTATAHDLRRSFGTRWAKRVREPLHLKELMRHANIETTMKYYVDIGLADIAKKLSSALGGFLGGSEQHVGGTKLPKSGEYPLK